jgi:tetratricopeptide (TPR) repeat protein
MLIDALGWIGLHYQAAGELVTARGQYELAISRYEEALAGRRLGPGARFGVNYARLADVLYSEAGDDQAAVSLYDRAELTGYVTNETRYRRAAALYRLGRFEEALVHAHRASLDVDETPALLLLTGNILARREDWFAAQASFDRLSARLRFELDRLPVLLPQERPAQGELVELLMRATNNLGVSWWRLAARAGDASLRGKAMAAFAESMRLFDALERDQATMLKPAIKNLAFLNLDFILRPQRGIDLEIYPEAPRDLGR